ncbi:MAG: hypothetical protein ACP5M9_00960 [Candidatus Micrarchaeia archaeon]
MKYKVKDSDDEKNKVYQEDIKILKDFESKINKDKILCFLKDIGSEASKAYIDVIKVKNEKTFFLDEKLMTKEMARFLKALGPHSYSYLISMSSFEDRERSLSAMTSPSLINNKEIINLVNVLGSSATNYFHHISKTGNVEVYTNPKVVNLAYSINVDLFSYYLILLESEKYHKTMLSDNFQYFLKNLETEVAISYLHTLNINPNNENLLSDLIIDKKNINFLNNLKVDSNLFFNTALYQNPQLFISEKSCNFINKLNKKIQAGYLKSLISFKSTFLLSEDVQNETIANFANKLEETSSFFFDFLSYKKIGKKLLDPNFLTEENSIFIKQLGNYEVKQKNLASCYLYTVANSSNPKLIIKKSTRDFILSLDKGLVEPYLSAIFMTNCPEILTSKSFINFTNSISNNTKKDNFFNLIQNQTKENLSMFLENIKRLKDTKILSEQRQIAIAFFKSSLINIVTDNKSLDFVFSYLSSLSLDELSLPKPKIDNISFYGDLLNDLLNKKYKLDITLNHSQLRNLFSVPEYLRYDLLKGFKEHNKISERIYQPERLNLIKISQLEKNERIKILLNSIIKYNLNEPKNEYSEFLLSQKQVKVAINFFSPKKFLGLKENIKKLIEIEGYTKAFEILEERYGKNELLKGFFQIPKITDSELEKYGKNSTLKSYLTKNMLDFDGRVFQACIFLPNGKYNKLILNYIKDPAIIIKYEKDDQIISAAICLFHKNERIFFVNSVEGKNTEQVPLLFYTIYEDLLERAKELGALKIIFLLNPLNTFPKKFIALMKDLGLEYKQRIPYNFKYFKGVTDVSTSFFEGYIKTFSEITNDLYTSKRN